MLQGSDYIVRFVITTKSLRQKKTKRAILAKIISNRKSLFCLHQPLDRKVNVSLTMEK